MLTVALAVLLAQCTTAPSRGQSVPQAVSATPGDDVLGFGILARLPGLWHGPVSTTTPAGSFENWYVDFRPVSSAQVSQYSTLDAQTRNFLSFFIVKYDGRLMVAMRTEGVFRNKGCVTYEVIDAVKESEGYYRFCDFVTGDNRAYTEFRFTDDGLVMEVYTNRFNSVSPLEIHSRWEARRADTTAAAEAVEVFSFPQPVMVKDFTDVFRHRSESIYYDMDADPYTSASQPHVGELTVAIHVDSGLAAGRVAELLLLLTTESLFDGPVFREENLHFISRYGYLPAGTPSHTFTHVHPGTYYLYAYGDTDGDKQYLSGDYMSSDLANIVRVGPSAAADTETTIDHVIP